MTSLSDEEYIGMSDEEEMARWAQQHADSEGLGEVIVEMPEDEEALLHELRDLGLVDDE